MLIPALLVAYASSFQADPALEQKVTFSCPATAASSAVEALRKQYGVSLSAADPVGKELLILRFHDVPLRTAMDKMAAAPTAGGNKDGKRQGPPRAEGPATPIR